MNKIRAAVVGAGTAVDGLAVSRICEAVHRSLESGKPERPIKP